MDSATPRHSLCFVAFVLAACALPTVASAQHGRPAPAPKSSPSAPPATPTPMPQYALPDPVATVNGQPVTKAELERITETLLNAGGRSLKTISVADQRVAYRQMLSNLIIDRLVNAKAAGETVSSLDVETRLDEFRRQYATPAKFDDDVRKSGQTLDQIRQNIQHQIDREHWIDHQID